MDRSFVPWASMLESRIAPSTTAVQVRQVRGDEVPDFPPPGPEDDPGPDSGSDGPIVYPTLPPTGPEGPG